MSVVFRVPESFVRLVELRATVTKPNVAFPSLRILFPLPIVCMATRAAVGLLELKRGYMVPIGRKPIRFAFLYYPSGVDRPRDSVIDRVRELSSEPWISSKPVADKGTVVASMFTS